MVNEGVKVKFESNLNDLDTFSSGLLQEVRDYRICLLKGDLGSGKTTLVKNLLVQLKSESEVSSPTFSIINEYESVNGEVIYHMDLYRLKTPDEIFDLGFMEYLDSGSICFIEWPEQIENHIDSPYLEILIEHSLNENRSYYVTRHD